MSQDVLKEPHKKMSQSYHSDETNELSAREGSRETTCEYPTDKKKRVTYDSRFGEEVSKKDHSDCSGEHTCAEDNQLHHNQDQHKMLGSSCHAITRSPSFTLVTRAPGQSEIKEEIGGYAKQFNGAAQENSLQKSYEAEASSGSSLKENIPNRRASLCSSKSSQIDHQVLSLTPSTGLKLFVKPTSKNNLNVIQKAILKALEGAVNAKNLKKIQDTIATHSKTCCHFLILFRSRHQFRGLYEYDEKQSTITKLAGTGPRSIRHEDILKYYKYDFPKRDFIEVQTKQISLTIIAITIQDHLWSKTLSLKTPTQ